MSDPTRPGDVPRDVPLAQLADHYARHILALVEHRHGLLPLADAQIVVDALTALRFGAALVERTEAARWSTAATALAAGAGLEPTAAAMGLDVDGLRIGLAGWAAQQHRHGLIGDARRAEIAALIAEDGAQ